MASVFELIKSSDFFWDGTLTNKYKDDKDSYSYSKLSCKTKKYYRGNLDNINNNFSVFVSFKVLTFPFFIFRFFKNGGIDYSVPDGINPTNKYSELSCRINNATTSTVYSIFQRNLGDSDTNVFIFPADTFEINKTYSALFTFDFNSNIINMQAYNESDDYYVDNQTSSYSNLNSFHIKNMEINFSQINSAAAFQYEQCGIWNKKLNTNDFLQLIRYKNA
jgi:hypothetical protein